MQSAWVTGAPAALPPGRPRPYSARRARAEPAGRGRRRPEATGRRGPARVALAGARGAHPEPGRPGDRRQPARGVLVRAVRRRSLRPADLVRHGSPARAVDPVRRGSACRARDPDLPAVRPLRPRLGRRGLGAPRGSRPADHGTARPLAGLRRPGRSRAGAVARRRAALRARAGRVVLGAERVRLHGPERLRPDPARRPLGLLDRHPAPAGDGSRDAAAARRRRAAAGADRRPPRRAHRPGRRGGPVA